jgi:hypothetical protein
MVQGRTVVREEVSSLAEDQMKLCLMTCCIMNYEAHFPVPEITTKDLLQAQCKAESKRLLGEVKPHSHRFLKVVLTD